MCGEKCRYVEGAIHLRSHSIPLNIHEVSSRHIDFAFCNASCYMTCQTFSACCTIHVVNPYNASCDSCVGYTYKVLHSCTDGVFEILTQLMVLEHMVMIGYMFKHILLSQAGFEIKSDQSQSEYNQNWFNLTLIT